MFEVSRTLSLLGFSSNKKCEHGEQGGVEENFKHHDGRKANEGEVRN
jgi:hypothetical protein